MPNISVIEIQTYVHGTAKKLVLNTYVAGHRKTNANYILGEASENGACYTFIEILIFAQEDLGFVNFFYFFIHIVYKQANHTMIYIQVFDYNSFKMCHVYYIFVPSKYTDRFELSDVSR